MKPANESVLDSAPWMEDFLDQTRAVGESLREAKFDEAEAKFCAFVAKARRVHQAALTGGRKVQDWTPLGDVLPLRLANLLENHGYLTVGSLRGITESELQSVGIGPWALAEIRRVAPRPERLSVVNEILAFRPR